MNKFKNPTQLITKNKNVKKPIIFEDTIHG